jgi:hypothetical protein
MSEHRISNPPILSSSRAGWNSIVAEKYCLPASEAHELSQHCSISIVLGHSFELDWRLDGGRLHKTQMCKGDISITPNGLLAQGRIERAKILLAENKLPLVEIGYRVGCSSQSNFTALFRKHVGITPKAYREQTKK